MYTHIFLFSNEDKVSEPMIPFVRFVPAMALTRPRSFLYLLVLHQRLCQQPPWLGLLTPFTASHLSAIKFLLHETAVKSHHCNRMCNSCNHPVASIGAPSNLPLLTTCLPPHPILLFRRVENPAIFFSCVFWCINFLLTFWERPASTAERESWRRCSLCTYSSCAAASRMCSCWSPRLPSGYHYGPFSLCPAPAPSVCTTCTSRCGALQCNWCISRMQSYAPSAKP